MIRFLRLRLPLKLRMWFCDLALNSIRRSWGALPRHLITGKIFEEVIRKEQKKAREYWSVE